MNNFMIIVETFVIHTSTSCTQFRRHVLSTIIQTIPTCSVQMFTLTPAALLLVDKNNVHTGGYYNAFVRITNDCMGSCLGWFPPTLICWTIQFGQHFVNQQTAGLNVMLEVVEHHRWTNQLVRVQQSHQIRLQLTRSETNVRPRRPTFHQPSCVRPVLAQW